MELKILRRFFPDMITQLHDLWCDTGRAFVECQGCLPQEALDMIFPWRVVGIPKSEVEFRPFSVGSLLVRIWLAALSAGMPQPPDNQYADRIATS
eukprot:2999146-Pyramimonas_sp.AAC.1